MKRNQVVLSEKSGSFGATGTIDSTGGFTGDEANLVFLLNTDFGSSSTDDQSCSFDIFDEAWTEDFGEVLVDYLDDGYSEGDTFVFNDKTVTAASKGEIGVMAGRCVAVDVGDVPYCNIAFELDEGTILVQGYFSNVQTMNVVGGSGCFQGLMGHVGVSDDSDSSTYTYSWTISS